MSTETDNDSPGVEQGIVTPTIVAQLGPYDVLCGRDRRCSSNVGNHQFRTLIQQSAHRYLKCESKFERSKAIGIIVEELQENPQGSIRFFKRVKGSDPNDEEAVIEQLDAKQSREKIAHALRDYAAQRRNNQAKEEPESPPRNTQSSELEQRIFPGSDPAPDFSYDQNVDTVTSSPHAYGRNPSPRISELLAEEARLQAEIEALQAPMNEYGGSVNQLQIPPQQQYYPQQQQHLPQQPLDEEHEASEGYDDFNVDDYNQFVKPLASSIRTVDTETDTATPLDVASQKYNAFEESFETLRGSGNSSNRSRDSIEKGGSRRSLKGQGLTRHQGSLRQIDVFQNSSSRTRMSTSSLRDSMGETDLMLMSMGTLTLNDSEAMNDSEIFPMGDSVVGFNQSRMGSSRLSMDSAKLDMSLQESTFDMSLQQSKLDMSFQTLDVTESSGEKRSSP